MKEGGLRERRRVAQVLRASGQHADVARGGTALLTDDALGSPRVRARVYLEGPHVAGWLVSRGPRWHNDSSAGAPLPRAVEGRGRSHPAGRWPARALFRHAPPYTPNGMALALPYTPHLYPQFAPPLSRLPPPPPPHGKRRFLPWGSLVALSSVTVVMGFVCMLYRRQPFSSSVLCLMVLPLLRLTPPVVPP